MNGAAKFAVFTSREGHYSIKKACLVLGLGEDSLILVDADKSGRMIVSDLELKLNSATKSGLFPLFVNATAGTTILGAFDPIDEISRLKSQFDFWLHVDGAWGGPALFSNELCHLMTGVQNADSAHPNLEVHHLENILKLALEVSQ